jgi:hypothetical protein
MISLEDLWGGSLIEIQVIATQFQTYFQDFQCP